MVIAAVSLIFYLACAIFYTRRFCWQYFAGAILIAFVSWLDDLYSVSIIWRLAVHTVSALLIISVFLSENNFAQTETGIAKILIPVLIFLWIVWLTNAYNFMDGIDGIAGLQAVVAGLGWLAVGTALNAPTIGFYGGILAFSSFAFLIKNWQPAKIFMGDVGSAFLGFTFAVLPILAARESGKNYERLFLTAAALVFLFLFDTVFTFCRRAFKGEKVWKPHRSHLYQRLVIHGFSHRLTAVIYGAAAVITGVIGVLGLLNTDYGAALYGAALTEAVILIILLKYLETDKISKK